MIKAYAVTWPIIAFAPLWLPAVPAMIVALLFCKNFGIDEPFEDSKVLVGVLAGCCTGTWCILAFGRYLWLL